MNAQRIRQRMSGDRRRGSLENLVRTRINGGRQINYPSVFAGVVRPLNGGGPQNAEDGPSGYVDEWEACPAGAGGQSGDYWLPIKASNLLSSTPGDPVIVDALYELKSRPFRYVLAASTGDPLGGIVFDYALGYENRSTGPDSGNHLSPLMATAVGIRPPFSGFGWTGPWTALSGSTGYTNSIQIAFARVWIDGVDASGIVEMPGGTDATIPLLSTYDMTDRSVSVDVWYRVFVTIPGSLGAFSDPPEEFVEGTNALVDFCGAMVTCDRNWLYRNAFNTYSGSPWHQSLANPTFGRASYGSANVGRWVNVSRYALQFDRQGPGGVSELLLRDQAGWTLTFSGSTTTMTHDATGDWVSVQIGREVPRIQVFKTGFDVTGATRRCNYSPRGTAQYESFLTDVGFGDYATAARADWQKNSTTLFANDGRVVASGAFTSPRTWYPPESGIPSGVDFYSQYPLEIFMVKP